MMENWWKSKLTPFDSELCVMVESLTGKPCEPRNGGDEQYFIVADYSDNPDPDFVSALMDAVAGRVGNRLDKIDDNPDEKYFVAYVFFSVEKYPNVLRLDRDAKPRIAVGDLYCRQLETIRAVQVKRENIGQLLQFVGNGEMEIEKIPGGKAVFHFKNACGSVYAHAPEFSYIVHKKDGLFNIVDKETFEKEYEQK